MNNHEANVLGRQLNDPDFVWPVGEVKAYRDSNAVFEFMLYGFPVESEAHLTYVKRDGIPQRILDVGNWATSTADYLPAYLYNMDGSNFMVLQPMREHPLVCVRFGCSHNLVESRQVGRYAVDKTCMECGYKWCVDSSD